MAKGILASAGLIFLFLQTAIGQIDMSKSSFQGCVDCFNFVAPSVISADAVNPTEVGLIVYDSDEKRFQARDSLGFWQNISSTSMDVNSVSTTHNLSGSEHVLFADASSGSFNVTLPLLSLVPKGKVFEVKKTDAGSNGVSILTSGSDVFHDSDVELNTLNESVKIVSDGARWQILDHSIPNGYKVVNITNAVTTNVANSWLDVTGANLTLPPGTWEIGYDVTLSVQAIGGTRLVSGLIAIFDSTNTYITGSRRRNQSGDLADTYTQATPASGVVRVTLTTTTTYKLRLQCNFGSSGNAKITADEDIFWARKIK